jgi:CRP/FNR family cyclic AMP-dependent transcriptional regulator
VSAESVFEQHVDGDIIFRQDQVGDRMYVMRSGRVRLFRTDRGVETVLADVAEGETFGELALFDRRPRSASARAIGDTTLRVITRVDVERMDCDPLLRGLLATLSRRLRTIDDAFERLMVREAPEREQLAAVWESKSWLD